MGAKYWALKRFRSGGLTTVKKKKAILQKILCLSQTELQRVLRLKEMSSRALGAHSSFTAGAKICQVFRRAGPRTSTSRIPQEKKLASSM